MERLVLALDIGATNLRMALVTKKGEILVKKKTKTRKSGKNGFLLTKQIFKFILPYFKKKSQIKAISIGSIGPLDLKRGGIKKSPNLPFDFIPLKKPLERKFKLPVFLFNDCHCGVWGEKIFGAGKKFENLVYVTISTGIGTGAVVDGRVLFGADFNAAEMGHQIIEEKYNFLCSCKKGRGHWEGIASGKNLPRFFKRWQRENKKRTNFKIKTSKDIFEMAKKKNKIFLTFLEDLAKINAKAVSNLILAYNPSLITFGGKVVLENEKFILPPLRKYLDRFLKVPKILVTPLGEDIVLLGAGALVFYPPKN